MEAHTHTPSLTHMSHAPPRRTAKGSACSQLMDDPHEDFLTDSGRDSGTQNRMKARLRTETKVARAMTFFSPYSPG